MFLLDALVDVVGDAVVVVVPVVRLIMVILPEVRLRKIKLGLAVEKTVAPSFEQWAISRSANLIMKSYSGIS